MTYFFHSHANVHLIGANFDRSGLHVDSPGKVKIKGDGESKLNGQKGGGNRYLSIVTNPL